LLRFKSKIAFQFQALSLIPFSLAHLGLNDIFNVASDRQVGVLPKLYEAVLFYIEGGTCDFYLRRPL
jgi:hypothetical protein